MKYKFLIAFLFAAFGAWAQPKTTTDIGTRYNPKTGMQETFIETKKVTEPDKAPNSGSGYKPSSSTPAKTNDTSPKPPKTSHWDNTFRYYEEQDKAKRAKDAEFEAWKRDRLANDKLERERLAKQYPNRVALLKADIEKAGISIEPNNREELNKLARKNYFSDLESDEIFPTFSSYWESYYWKKKPEIYQITFPIAETYLAKEKALADAKAAQRRKEEEAKEAQSKIWKAVHAKEDALHGRDLIRFREDNKIGLRNIGGAIVLKPTYDSIGYFSYGLASVRNNKKFGVINKWGEEKITPHIEFDYIYSEGRSHDKDDSDIMHLMRIINGKKRGVFNSISNKMAVPVDDYRDVRLNRKFKVYKVQKGKKYGLFDYNGTEIAPLIYDGIYLPEYVNSAFDELYIVKIKGKLGCMDKTGKLVVPVVYDDISKRHDLLECKRDGKLYRIDINGKEISFLEWYTRPRR